LPILKESLEDCEPCWFVISFFFFSSRRRHTRFKCDWSSDVCSSDLAFRGGPELWVTGSEGRPVDVSIFTVRTETHRDLDNPIRSEISQIERISSRSIPGQIKVSGAYVNSFFARRTAERSGFDDGLMFDREGHLTEASAANVFLIAGDRLITPRLKPDVFPGITRRVFLELAREKGV